MRKGIIFCIFLLLTLVVFPLPSIAGNATISTDGDYDLAAHGHVNGDTITINAGCMVRLIGSTGTTYTNFQIVCGTGVNLTIENVNIDDSANSDKCPLAFTGSGNTLTLSGTNTLKGGQDEPAVRAEDTTVLEIKGSGALDALGGLRSAGIGGGFSGGSITISGGTVSATGGQYGAGIGGGRASSGGDIDISGGTVDASGGYYSAGIGGGYLGSGGDIDISGGTVDASGGYYSAGIGGGYIGSGGDIDISGGTVDATGGQYGAGIGGGNSGSGGSIIIEGGTVDATGGQYGAGIGGGSSGSGGSITIEGGVVDATGSDYSAGIGGSFWGSGGVISISGGVVYAQSGLDAPCDIGYGLNDLGGTLSITGTAAVFLNNNTCVTPALPNGHINYASLSAADGKVYGVKIPDGWTEGCGGYLRLFTLTYNDNGGSGLLPDPVTQHIGTTCAAVAGTGLSRTDYRFGGWNTSANGSGTTYQPGDTVAFTNNRTLYAVWDDLFTIKAGGTYTLSEAYSHNTLSIETSQSVTLQGGGVTLTDFQIVM